MRVSIEVYIWWCSGGSSDVLFLAVYGGQRCGWLADSHDVRADPLHRPGAAGMRHPPDSGTLCLHMDCAAGIHLCAICGGRRCGHYSVHPHVPPTLPDWSRHAATQQAVHGCFLTQHRRPQQDQLQHTLRHENSDDHLPGHRPVGLQHLLLDYSGLDGARVRKVRRTLGSFVPCRFHRGGWVGFYCSYFMVHIVHYCVFCPPSPTPPTPHPTLLLDRGPKWVCVFLVFFHPWKSGKLSIWPMTFTELLLACLDGSWWSILWNSNHAFVPQCIALLTCWRSQSLEWIILFSILIVGQFYFYFCFSSYWSVCQARSRGYANLHFVCYYLDFGIFTYTTPCANMVVFIVMILYCFFSPRPFFYVWLLPCADLLFWLGEYIWPISWGKVKARQAAVSSLSVPQGGREHWSEINQVTLSLVAYLCTLFSLLFSPDYDPKPPALLTHHSISFSWLL